MEEAERVRKEGREARLAGQSVGDCPYGADDEARRSAWMSGWGTAEVPEEALGRLMRGEVPRR